MIACHICGRSAQECSGYLERVNETGRAGVWECRPGCEAPEMERDDAVLAAVEGRFDEDRDEMITDRQREILHHALGLTYDATPTRDHFNAEAGTQDCKDCERLVELGLMVKLIPIAWVPGFVFRVTDRGRQIALEEPSDA